MLDGNGARVATPRPNAHFLALLLFPNGSLTAPPVGHSLARSPTDRIAVELGTEQCSRFTANCGESAPHRPSSRGAMAFKASAIAPVRPAEL